MTALVALCCCEEEISLVHKKAVNRSQQYMDSVFRSVVRSKKSVRVSNKQKSKMILNNGQSTVEINEF